MISKKIITQSIKKGESTLFDEWKIINNLNEEITFDFIKKFIENDEVKNKLHLLIRHLNKFDYKYINVEKFLLATKETNKLKQALIYYENKNHPNYLKIKKEIILDRKNIYDPLYISEKYNISYEKAIEKINNFKKNKATNKENFIRKYGEKEGIKRYEEYCKNSDSKSLNFYIKKYGEEKAKILFAKNSNSSSKRCVNYWIKQGFSKEEAIVAVSDFQRNNSGVFLNYYLNNGFSQEEAISIIKKINKKRFAKELNYDFLLKKGLSLKETHLIMSFMKNNYNKKFFKEDFLNDYYNSDNKLHFLIKNINILKNSDLIKYKTDFKLYIQQVNYYTFKNDLTTLENHDRYDNLGRKYHLDHMYSKKQGFIDNISPEIIGSIVNLKYIPQSENLKKLTQCTITKQELLERYKEKINEN